MASVSVTHVTSNKYIAIFQGTYAMRNNNYNYKMN